MLTCPTSAQKPTAHKQVSEGLHETLALTLAGILGLTWRAPPLERPSTGMHSHLRDNVGEEQGPLGYVAVYGGPGAGGCISAGRHSTRAADSFCERRRGDAARNGAAAVHGIMHVAHAGPHLCPIPCSPFQTASLFPACSFIFNTINNHGHPRCASFTPQHSHCALPDRYQVFQVQPRRA